MSITRSSNLIIRRNLLAHPNRYTNAGGLTVSGGNSSKFPPGLAHHILIEENELYFFHRNGIVCIENGTHHCTIRRNYVNARNGRSTCPGGDYCDNDPMEGIILYAVSDNIVENNIVENTDGIGSSGARNRFLGNISINNANLFMAYKHPAEYEVASGIIYSNNVGIGGPKTNVGMLMRSVIDARVSNNSFFGIPNGAITANNSYDPRQGEGKCAPYRPSPLLCSIQQNPGITVLNTLVSGAASGVGLTNAEQFDIRVFRYDVGWNLTNGMWRTGTETREVSSTPPPGASSSPDIGSCRVYIPDSSSLKRRGLNGADIGANILYRYKDGSLTSTPLWSPSSVVGSGGEFPRGALVAGVNDIAGSSLYDVHARLNVNRSGCPFPASFLSGLAPAPEPAPAPAPDPASVDTVAPTATITSPLNGGIVTITAR